MEDQELQSYAIKLQKMKEGSAIMNYIKFYTKYFTIKLLLIDIFLGILITQTPIIDIVSNLTIIFLKKSFTNFDFFLEEMLKGGNSGYKINQEINRLMNSFYRYYVSIFSIQMNGVDEEIIFKYLTYTSYIGSSFFLSVLHDFLIVLTMHIQCFYVYSKM
uniref:Uncharacterized protein n=1 Tax=Strongyloides venezuelensis TaxID=75913 RepID=A0A0K0EVI0_STRVS